MVTTDVVTVSQRTVHLQRITGTITIQGTLAVTPVEADWFDVHTYTAAEETASKIASFTGNYVWIRAKVVYTDGTVSSISLNH